MSRLTYMFLLVFPLFNLAAQDAPAPAVSGQAATPIPSTSASEEIDPLLAEDIRDIKEVIAIPEPTSWWPMALAAVAGMGILGVALWLWLRKRHTPTPPDPLAHALKDLEATRSLMGSESVEAFAISLSQVLRRYIEIRYRKRAVHQTTEEFLESLAEEETGPWAEQRPSLRRFLNQCDSAKFARARLSEKEMDQLYQTARDFLTISDRAIPRTERAPNTATPNPQLVSEA